MRIILSRKGFDSSNGGCPSPILPDGTLLSLPIPSKNDAVKYSGLYYEDKSYFQIIKELKPGSKIKFQKNEDWIKFIPDDKVQTITGNSKLKKLFPEYITKEEWNNLRKNMSTIHIDNIINPILINS